MTDRQNTVYTFFQAAMSNPKNNKNKKRKKTKGRVHPDNADYDYFEDEYEVDPMVDGGKKRNNQWVLY